MADEEGDLLGGLPRSRPGVRSGKRASSGPPKPAAADGAPRPAAKRVTKPKPARTATKPPPKPRSAPRSPEPASGTEEALRLASGAAGAVLGTASSVTRGILRRLPKP